MTASGGGSSDGLGDTTVVGVVGTGNMGAALVRGLARPEAGGPALLIWDKVETSARRLLDCGGVSLAVSLDDLVGRVDVVVVVVKPKDAAEVLGAMAGRMGEKQAVISSMAGVTIEWMRSTLGPGPALFRIMPNLGVELGVGAVAVSAEPGTADEYLQEMERLLEPLGQVETVPEDLLDVVTAVSGSGPAFVALAMEGLEDGAVSAGLSRQAARIMVREAALETARLLSRRSDSPARVRHDLLTSGVADEDAIAALDDRDVRAAFRQAVEAALERSRRLGGSAERPGR